VICDLVINFDIDMKISRNWLGEYVEVSGDADKLASDIMMSAFEVEDVRAFGVGLDDIVVGNVTHVKPHPNADKLQVATVKVGALKKYQIVCGAPNVAVGQMVAVALPGVVLPDGLKIGKRDIRGVESHGMICSEKELGLSDRHEGIMVLDDQVKIGSRLYQAIAVKDQLLDINVTSNRPDAHSHVGIAREVAAIRRVRLHLPQLEDDALFSASLPKFPIDLRVTASSLCSRYEGVVVANLSVRQSPWWIRQRLMACGVRPINNIVDASNYVLLELGQPTHAFDYDMISGREVVVRKAKKNESITTLDDQKRVLDSSMVVIADAKKSVAIAGVMGGLDSAVSETTTTIFIESAIFDPVSIRRTSRSLGLRTDASIMFERGIYPHLAHEAIVRVVALLRETCPDLTVGNAVQAGKPLPKPYDILLDIFQVERLLGVSLARKQIIELLGALGCTIDTKKDAYKPASYRDRHVRVVVPYYRPDLRISEDLIEEIGRLYGYHHITPELPLTRDDIVVRDPLIRAVDDAKDILVSLGLSEIQTKSFVGEREIAAVGEDVRHHIEIQNPVAPDQRFMRMNLLESVLRPLALNRKYHDRFGLFEVGRGFRIHRDSKRHDTPAHETSRLVVAIADSTPDQDVYVSLKRVVDVLMHRLRVPQEDILYTHLNTIASTKRTRIEKSQWYHPSKSARIVIGGDHVGYAGVIHPQLVKAHDLPLQLAVCEIDVGQLISHVEKQPMYRRISAYPASVLDVSFVVPMRTASADILQTIREYARKIFADVELLDVYHGERVGKGKKSISFRITYQASDHTLTDEEVKRVHSRVIDAVTSDHGAQLRM
jgi:phenylalanyl-tRNA synthetase beta chain